MPGELGALKASPETHTRPQREDDPRPRKGHRVPASSCYQRLPRAEGRLSQEAPHVCQTGQGLRGHTHCMSIGEGPSLSGANSQQEAMITSKLHFMQGSRPQMVTNLIHTHVLITAGSLAT